MDQIYFRTDRDEDDEGTFVFAFTSSKKNLFDEDLCIGHLHVGDEYINHFFGRFYIEDIDVSNEFRRQGIATTMLNKMSEHLNASPVGASSVFSDDGKLFWNGYQKNLTQNIQPSADNKQPKG